MSVHWALRKIEKYFLKTFVGLFFCLLYAGLEFNCFSFFSFFSFFVVADRLTGETMIFWGKSSFQS